MSTATEKQGTHDRAFATALWRELVIIAGLCAFLFFYGLGSFGLVGADEPRYAQIAREMLQRHDWIVPVLNGTPWLEKPVLFYWEAMLSYSVFGVSDWAARLPNALNATAVVLAFYFFVRRFRPGLQLDAALMVASCTAFIGFGHAASTDMPLASLLTVAMLSWLTWFQTDRRRWLAVFYVLLGLGTLAKGPVAPFLAALIIVPFALIRRKPRLILRTLWPRGIFLFLLVSLPWYVAIQARIPEFFRTFILEHNLARYGSNLYRHHQPFWYYIPIVLLALLPWTVLAITGLVSAIREGYSMPAGFWQIGADTDEAEDAQNRAVDFPVFFALWGVLPVIFFSFSGSKLPGYILPAVPGFLLLTVEWLARKYEDSESPSFVLMLGHVIAANLLLAAALLSYHIVYRVKPNSQALLVACVFTGLVALISIVFLLLRGTKVLRLVTMIPVILGIGFVLKVVSPAIDNTQSARPVAKEIEAMHQSLPVAGFGIRREVEYGLGFYLNRPIAMYDRAEIPPSKHIVVIRKRSADALAALIPGRTVDCPRHFEPQDLDICFVGAAK